MPQTIDEIFADRLTAELAVKPHGYQTELAAAVGISKSRLNNLLKCRRGSTEGVRRDICRGRPQSMRHFDPSTHPGEGFIDVL